MFDIEWLSVARSWVVHDGVVHCEVAVRAESVRAMRRNRKSTEAHKPNRDEQVQDKHRPTHGIPSNENKISHHWRGRAMLEMGVF